MEHSSKRQKATTGISPYRAEKPTVAMSPSSGDAYTGSRERILEPGVLCRAVVEEVHALGLRHSNGDDLYAFVLRVMTGGRRATQLRVADGVPAAALRSIYPGTTVSVRWMPEGEDRELVIDWQAAIEPPAGTAA